MGNPASIISTPSFANCLAISIFCLISRLAPGDCSPSRKVVSNISIFSITNHSLSIHQSNNYTQKYQKVNPFLIKNIIHGLEENILSFWRGKLPEVLNHSYSRLSINRAFVFTNPTPCTVLFINHRSLFGIQIYGVI